MSAFAMLIVGLFVHFALLSLAAVGGFMVTIPGMYAYLVDSTHLLTPEQFAATVAFGQSLPGPNVLIAAVLGWAAAGPWGAAATFCGTTLTFSSIALFAGRQIREHAESFVVRAYKKGLSPIVIGLLYATGYLLMGGIGSSNPLAYVWAAVVTVLVCFTRIPLIFLIACGGLLGGLGLFA